MKKEIITKELQEKHLKFTNYIASLTNEDYVFSYQEKWSAGKHLDHIIKSVMALSKAFGYPKWILKYKFGKANRSSRTKDELEKKYLKKLKTAKPTPSRFQPNSITVSDKQKMIDKLHTELKRLIKRTTKYSENDLDNYILPHPLLGYLTCREMLYFTDIHVEHHKEFIGKYFQYK